MSKILFVNACVRENSRTLELAQCILENLSGEIEKVDLFALELHPLDQIGMETRAKASQSRDFSDSSFDFAKQFASAEVIVIAAPYWDLMFPAVLKTYLENVSVAGITFSYSDNGVPLGLCKAKKLYYVTTAGGYIGNNNFGFTYMKALAQTLFGIPTARCILAEGLDISDDCAREAMEKAMKEIQTKKDGDIRINMIS